MGPTSNLPANHTAGKVANGHFNPYPDIISNPSTGQYLPPGPSASSNLFNSMDLHNTYAPPPLSPPPVTTSDFPPDLLYSGRRKQALKSDRAESAVVVEAHSVDFSDDAVAVNNFANQTSQITCGGCHRTRCHDRNQLLAHFAKSGPECRPFSFAFLLTCDRCGGFTCLGCRALLSCPPEHLPYKASSPADGVHLSWHCDRGRAALIWFLLCGYDNQAKHNKPTAPASRPRKAKQQSKLKTFQNYVGIHSPKANGFGSKGVGYGVDGIDYSDEEFDDESFSAFEGTGMTLAGHVVTPATKSKSKAKLERIADPDDELTTGVMISLAALLRMLSLMDPEYDYVLKSMLLRSSILDRAAELLRNDSLEDALARAPLYAALLDFIRSLSLSSRILSTLLHEERSVNKLGHDLSKVSYGFKTLLKTDQTDKAAPLIDAIRNLAQQSAMMCKNYQANQEVFGSEEGDQIMNLCTNIMQCDEALQNSAPRSTAKGRSKEPANVDKDAWQKELAILDVPDADILSVHYSSKDATNCKPAKPGRMRALVKEMTNLRTSLPPGIFVRYGESRLDVLKVLIVGPKRTPYENGLFEFDIFCPANYPDAPPQMHIKTTGGGRHRFNPNLYADGKVCLSLLNTWQGQPWTPGQSTILQVLVSIQAMVFCDEPHCNEPGFESQAGSDQSKQYNRNQYHAVVKYAMLEWLEGERKVTPSRDAIKHGYYDSSWTLNGAIPPPPVSSLPGGPATTSLVPAPTLDKSQSTGGASVPMTGDSMDLTETSWTQHIAESGWAIDNHSFSKHASKYASKKLTAKQQALKKLSDQQKTLDPQMKSQMTQLGAGAPSTYGECSTIFDTNTGPPLPSLPGSYPPPSADFPMIMDPLEGLSTIEGAPAVWPAEPPPPYAGHPTTAAPNPPPTPADDPWADFTSYKPKSKKKTKHIPGQWQEIDFPSTATPLIPQYFTNSNPQPINPASQPASQPIQQPPAHASWPPSPSHKTGHTFSIASGAPSIPYIPTSLSSYHPPPIPPYIPLPTPIPGDLPVLTPGGPAIFPPSPAPPPPGSAYSRRRRDHAAVIDKGGLWDEVVKKHFEVNHDEILDTVCTWINDKATSSKFMHRVRAGGRKLGSSSGESTASPSTSRKGEDLKAKGKDLKAQLSAALQELSQSREEMY